MSGQHEQQQHLTEHNEESVRKSSKGSGKCGHVFPNGKCVTEAKVQRVFVLSEIQPSKVQLTNLHPYTNVQNYKYPNCNFCMLSQRLWRSLPCKLIPVET
ncbi:unnamed protein product [Ceratitis capitata]|uniref:(Mediterranean fruit fly) hypothetical protein n=1 Tax=Ceratitis capitata TaxID=7213 RepID=A0A811VK34_CERCA|nr:unnamed protein product [Ceratitis capitata]